MKFSRFHISLLSFAFLCISLGGFSQKKVEDFSLLNVNGETVKLSDYSSKKAVVIIFTGNHCVYSKKYEDRIVALSEKYKTANVQLILINSNDPLISEDDRIEVMKERAIEKNYLFPYLQDLKANVAKAMGATKNPESFVVIPKPGSEFHLVYSGKIDDNPLIAEKVSKKYLVEVLDAILSDNIPEYKEEAAIGCGIKGLE